MNRRRMGKWIREHHDDAGVREWLRRHPPPAEWEGSPMEYAYTQMPRMGLVDLAIGAVVLSALGGLAAWWIKKPSSRRPARRRLLPWIR